MGRIGEWTVRGVVLGLLGVGGLSPSAGLAAPVTPADLASPPGDWLELSATHMTQFEVSRLELEIQMLPLTTELLHAFMSPLSGAADFPTSPDGQAELINALKPHDQSILVYMACKQAGEAGNLWSPVFGLTAGAFSIRLIDSEWGTVVEEDDEETHLAAVSLFPLAEFRPQAPGDAWRCIYEMVFTSPEDWEAWRQAGTVALRYDSPQDEVLMNITDLRGEIALDAEHNPAGSGRSPELVDLFFAHFPPKTESPAIADAPAPE